MKIQLLSDLHITHAPFTPPVTDADIVVLAGDISTGADGVKWAARAFPDKPVIAVNGNHEFYGWDVNICRRAIQAAAGLTPNVRVLDGEGITFALPGETPVRILGATLWTDFALFGKSRASQHARQVQAALNDYRLITFGTRRLEPRDTLEWHQKELAWLKLECTAARERGEKVVVVTHHGPSIRSSASQYLKDPVTAGFLSNLEDFCAKQVDWFLHGHVHHSAQYSLGNCRVVVNPRGYPFSRHDPGTAFENRVFDPALVLQI